MFGERRQAWGNFSGVRCHRIEGRAGGRDTNRAEAVFRTMRQTMEASEEDRFQIEAELVMARAGAWS